MCKTTSTSNNTTTSTPSPDPNEVEALAGKVLQAIVGSQQIQAAWLGEKLGWYQALSKSSDCPLTPEQLAAETGSSERYAREWCEHQTVSGWISCQDATAPAKERRYYLSPAQKAVLTDSDSLALVLPICKMVANAGLHLEQLKDAYKTDGGVSWGEFGKDTREGMAAANRPFYLHQLGQQSIPAGLPVVDKILKEGGRVADIGAGCGWSSIGVAQAYPNSTVDAFDLDEPSIEQAQFNIESLGLKDRVKARCVDVGTLNDQDDKYDLVMALECVHDMSDPVSVLRSMKELAGNDGTVMVMDEKVQPHFTGDSSDVMEQLFYGFSLICCLPDCKSHPNSAETGACMRPSQLEWYAIEAGFRGVEILEVPHDMFRFYKLKQK